MTRSLTRGIAAAREGLVVTAPPWVVARMLVLGGLVVAAAAGAQRSPAPDPARPFLAWDGEWYTSIAEDGYPLDRPEAVRFFPLFPLLVRVVALPLLGNAEVAAAVVANGAALALGVVMYRLVVAERADRRLGRDVVWLTFLFPAGAVLALAYAEALALTVTVAGFLALRRRRWWWAAAAGALLGLARPVGVLFALPAAVEAARGLRGVRWGDVAGRAAAVVAAPAAAVAYLAWVGARFGDFWLPLRVQGEDHLRGDFAWPPVRLVQAVADGVTGASPADGVHALALFAFAGLTVVAFLRWPVSYGMYAAGLLLVAFSAENLGSFERYGLSAFPLLLAFADLVPRPALLRAAFMASGAGLVAFTALAMVGTVVP